MKKIIFSIVLILCMLNFNVYIYGEENDFIEDYYINGELKKEVPNSYINILKYNIPLEIFITNLEENSVDISDLTYYSHIILLQGDVKDTIHMTYLIGRDVFTVVYKNLDDGNYKIRLTNRFGYNLTKEDLELAFKDNPEIQSLKNNSGNKIEIKYPNAGEILGNISRGNHKNSNQKDSLIIVPRPEKSIISGGFNNNEVSKKNIKDFEDIGNHWAKKEIISFASKGYIKGYDDGNFKPDEFITFGEMFTVLSELNIRPVMFENDSYNYILENLFTNSTETKSHWSKNYILKAYESGYFGNPIYYTELTGAYYKKGAINDYVSRGNASIYLSNMLDYDLENIKPLNFTDEIPEDKNFNLSINTIENNLLLNQNKTTYNGVSAMVDAGIIAGYEDGSFKANNNITRGEFVFLVENILKIYNYDKELIHDNLYGNFHEYNWTIENEMLVEINKLRNTEGLSDLEIDKDLSAIAWIRSLDIHLNFYEKNHITKNFQGVENIINIFGINKFKSYGENLYLEPTFNGKTTNNILLSNNDYKKNILNENFDSIGFATNVYNGSIELFGRKK